MGETNEPTSIQGTTKARDTGNRERLWSEEDLQAIGDFFECLV